MSFAKKTKTLLSILALSALTACQTAEKVNTIEQPPVSDSSKDVEQAKAIQRSGTTEKSPRDDKKFRVCADPQTPPYSRKAIWVFAGVGWVKLVFLDTAVLIVSGSFLGPS